MPTTTKIVYLEFQTADVGKSKAFFEQVFGWTFKDYGPEYTSFDEGEVLSGAFYQSAKQGRIDHGGALAVLRDQELEKALERVEAAGGTITKPIFAFPGGRRFHFTEPGGNELSVCALE